MTDKGLKKWYRARNMCFGINGERKDFYAGLQLARHCETEEAKWLCNLFPPQEEPLPLVEVVNRFKQQGESDGGRSLYWFVYVTPLWELGFHDILGKSARLGYPLAQTSVARIMRDNKLAYDYCLNAATKHEHPDAMYLLTQLSQNGVALMPREQKMAWLKKSAVMGYERAISAYGYELGETWERYHWWRKTVLRDEPILRHVIHAASGPQKMDISFELGRILEGGLDAVSNEIYEIKITNETSMWHAKTHLGVYRACCSFARQAMDLWVMAGLRNKDMRRVIAKMIWKGRKEWLETIAYQRLLAQFFQV